MSSIFKGLVNIKKEIEKFKVEPLPIYNGSKLVLKDKKVFTVVNSSSSVLLISTNGENVKVEAEFFTYSSLKEFIEDCTVKVINDNIIGTVKTCVNIKTTYTETKHEEVEVKPGDTLVLKNSKYGNRTIVSDSLSFNYTMFHAIDFATNSIAYTDDSVQKVVDFYKNHLTDVIKNK
jgi:hypothetical protein